MEWSNFKDMLNDRPEFKKVVDEVCLYDSDQEVGMIAHFGKWYKMGVTKYGLPFPMSDITETVGVDSPPARFNVFGILDGLDEEKEHDKIYEFLSQIFKHHPPKEGEWMSISESGECNYPVNIDKHEALSMVRRITGWLEMKPGENIGIRICDDRLELCDSCFNKTAEDTCPFGKIVHSKSRVKSSCRTMMVAGLFMCDVEDELAELYIKILRGESATMSNECKLALLSLLEFYSSKTGG